MSVSLNTGYDTEYLTKDAGTGADYLTGAAGEPPGYWQGAGARALGLVGEVDGDVMRALYHEDIGPDGQVLVRRQRRANYPVADGSLYKRIEAEIAAEKAARGRFFTPEEERALRLKLRSAFRTVVPFYDYTYSAPKSVSVLWASLLVASVEAEGSGNEAGAEQYRELAAQVRAAVKRANDRMIAVAERELAFVRTGHHSATSGQWRDAEGFIVASFPQHDSRDGDMQLHVHNAIANRGQRADGADDKWRALHGQPLFTSKVRMGILADRFLAQELELLGWLSVLREDGLALEVGGISEEAAGTFSSRSREARARTRELVLEYERDHGHAPGKQAMWGIRQRAVLETREAKNHNPPAAGQQLAAWARKAERSGIGALAALHEAASAYSAEHEPGRLPTEAERARIIRKAVAAVQRGNAAWDRAHLILELGHVLPALPADVDPEEYLNGLADEAVSGRAEGVNVLQIAPAADKIDVTRLGLRKDGTSIYRPPYEEKFCTAEHRDREQWLADAAVIPVPQRVTAETAAAALAGTDLDYSQREACAGLLASARLINCLVAPAGTGKTHVTAAFARVWEQERAGRVIGLTASTNAARVMAEEAAKAGARMETFNIARFLGKLKDTTETRPHVPVYPGDVLIVDEATQVSTEDLLRSTQIARRCGAMIIGTFDPEQLGAVDAGGIFPLIAARHGSWRLTEIRRFTHAWEAEASLKLRAGDITALAEYDARGRVYHGPQDRVYDDAVDLYLNGLLSGQDALLMATSNETAARLAALVRERLAQMGQVGEPEFTLSDGNQAGRGDLIRARLNTHIDADGQTLANRDVVRVESVNDSAYGRLAAVRRQLSPGEWSRPFHVPVAYLEQSAELAYAGNVHVAQGRTVDRAHLVVDGNPKRSTVYVGASRAREKNTLHVVTGASDPAQPTRAERDAYAQAQLKRAAALRASGRPDLARDVRLRMPDRPSERQMAPWEAVLAQALQQDDPERTALEEIQAAQDFTTHTGHLFELRQAFWQLDVVPKIDEMVRERITPAEYERYIRDPERGAFLQALRAHEIGGRRIEDVLDSITAEPLTGLRSIAAGLHGRAGKEPPPVRGETTRWAERTPAQASAEIQAADQMADRRQAELGRQAASQAPEWAVRAWGQPPAEAGALRDDWQRRAGLVASYRELVGITDPAQAIGPVPSGQADLTELFHASVRTLQLPDEAALLKAMGQGELEAAVDQHDRALSLAPPDVQAQIGEQESQLEGAQVRAHIAGTARDADAVAEAEAQEQEAAETLARLAVADAARREWNEAHAGQAAQAEAAERELRHRGLAERIPVTDAEVAQASSAERETPAMDPAEHARLKAEQAAELRAEQEARREAEAQRTPVTDAEIARYGAQLAPETSPEAARELAAWWQAFTADGHAASAAAAEDLGRRFPATDAEVAEALAQPRDYPAPEPAEMERLGEAEREAAAEAREREQVTEPEAERTEPPIDPEAWAAQKAQQAAEVETGRAERAEAAARQTPVTDAEAARAAIHEALTDLSAKVGQLAEQEAGRDAERRAQMAQLAAEEPTVREPQAEPSLESSWQPGNAQGQYEPEAADDYEAEIG